jgi:outer membrane protein assembly factor BamD (BamD/ComL family)
MSVSGIVGHTFIPYNAAQVQNSGQQIQQEFWQLGQDLQAGNQSAAQSDLTALQQLTQSNSASSTQSTNSITQEFNQLSQDLKAGNLSAAQADYTKLQQDFQTAGVRAHHSHRHHYGESNGSNDINQLFQQLGQELQSGNVTTAQQTYAALQQDLQLYPGNGPFSAASPQTKAISATA